MTIRKRAVTVMQVPGTSTAKQSRLFLNEIAHCMNMDRPYVVLDCSKVQVMDKSVVHLLLCCLEEAMKRNGDVRLSAMPLKAEALLEQTGVNRLFDIFDTTAAAVNSFHQLPFDAVSETHLHGRALHESESAA